MASILVVGGGIGGLCAARALAGTGHAVTLVERRPRLEGSGAGLLLPVMTLRRLRDLGADVEPAVLRLQELRITTAGAALARVVERVSVPRADLHQVLADGIPDAVELRLGLRLEALTVDRTGVTARLDGARRRFDLVVGADGARSTVRSLIAPRTRLRAVGQTCWRGIVRYDGGSIATESWNGRGRIGAVPLRDGRTYCYLVLSARPGASPERWRDEDFPTADLRERALLDRMSHLATADLLHHDLHDLRRPVWGSGRVALLGDAAHAMAPNLGAGAAEAIEDALALASAATGDLGTAVGRYARSRGMRALLLLRGARLIGRAAHLRSPAARSPRDVLMRLGLQATGAG